MGIQDWIGQAAKSGLGVLSAGGEVAGAGVGYVTQAIGGLWIYGSTSSSNDYEDKQFDERHYFLLPDPKSESNYSLSVSRCLPDGVPPVNDLPKRRFLHLPNAEARPMLEEILLQQARTDAEKNGDKSGLAPSSRLGDLADHIDRLEAKVFGGVLLIGGLVALVNPVVGAAIALKSLAPSLGLLLSKHGLKYAEDSLSASEAKSRIKAAEKDVQAQFRGSQTQEVINPLLELLDRAIKTDESELDPMLAYHEDISCLTDADQRRSMQLTRRAILDCYDTLRCNPTEAQRAGLGPEDLRFLDLLEELSKQE